MVKMINVITMRKSTNAQMFSGGKNLKQKGIFLRDLYVTCPLISAGILFKSL